MDQNQTNSSVDNDLQKAIDDITNTTNIDPVFSDPVAAPSSIPEGDTGELGEPVGPFPEPAPESVPEPTPEPASETPKVEVPEPTPEPIAPLESMNIPEFNNPLPEPTTETTEEPTPEASETAPQGLNTSEVKKAALRDLIPLLDHVNMDQTQRFNVYKDIFEELKDYTVLEPAYQAAREIPDETARAEALLYLVQSIDKM